MKTNPITRLRCGALIYSKMKLNLHLTNIRHILGFHPDKPRFISLDVSTVSPVSNQQNNNPFL